MFSFPSYIFEGLLPLGKEKAMAECVVFVCVCVGGGGWLRM